MRSAAACLLASCLQQAAVLASAPPEPRTSLAVRADEAAQAIQRARNLPEASARSAALDAAISHLDALVAEAAAQGDDGLRARLESDRAYALRQRGRHAEALSQVAALRARGTPIRPYARQAEADSLLALRRPEEARAIYSALAAEDPANRDAILGRFYAEVESEDFEAAFRTADALGDPVLAAQARHYAGLHGEAWNRLEAAKPDEPAYVRSARAAVAAARGWPRLAHEELEAAAALAPNDIGIAAALASSHLRRRDPARARMMEAELRARHPGDPSVERLARELTDFQRPAWWLDARARREEGNAAAAPGPGFETSARLYSSPWANRFRLFAGAGHANAKPPEGEAVRNRGGAGIEWRGADFSAEASAWDNGGTLSRGSGAASASWSPDDHWNVALDYQTFALETPLRAILHGVTADGGGAGVGYSWHESRSAWAGLRAHQFTDGNRREQYRLAWMERVITAPAGFLALRPEVYGSRNTLAGAPYFNPSRDLAISISVEAQGLLHRRYEENLHHRLVGRVGRYRQEGYDDGWVGAVAYEQTWQAHALLELRWGIEAGRARYDGTGENFAVLFVSASGRF